MAAKAAMRHARAGTILVAGKGIGAPVQQYAMHDAWLIDGTANRRPWKPGRSGVGLAGGNKGIGQLGEMAGSGDEAG